MKEAATVKKFQDVFFFFFLRMYLFFYLFHFLDVLFTHSGDSPCLVVGETALCGLRKFVLAQTESLRAARSLWVTMWQMWWVIISAIKTYSSPLTFTPLKERGTDTVYTVNHFHRDFCKRPSHYHLSRRIHNYLFVYFNKEASKYSSLKHTRTLSNTRKNGQKQE